MFPAAFDYVKADSLDQALALLAQHGDDAKLIAGGHSLIPAMKLRLAQPKLLIDIGRLKDEMAYIRQEGQTLTIGALTTHYQIETSNALKEAATALPEAAAVLADVQVRNKGTIGGVLAHADPAADYPAVLLALGAEVVVAGPNGSRTIPIDRFFTGPFTGALEAGKIITAVRVPVQPARSASVYRKFVRRANDYGMTGVSAFLQLNQQGEVSQARIGVTCVALSAFRAQATELALVGRKPTPELIALAAEAAVQGVDVQGDAYVPAEYRAHLTTVETRRAIEEALKRIG